MNKGYKYVAYLGSYDLINPLAGIQLACSYGNDWAPLNMI